MYTIIHRHWACWGGHSIGWDGQTSCKATTIHIELSLAKKLRFSMGIRKNYPHLQSSSHEYMYHKGTQYMYVSCVSERTMTCTTNIYIVQYYIHSVHNTQKVWHI